MKKCYNNLATLMGVHMKFAISTLTILSIFAAFAFPSHANSRDDFPGRRQGGGTWNSEPVPVEVGKI
jgi:hypothetical protein